MGVGEICTRDVIVVAPDEDVRRAAELMERHAVGDVIVLDGGPPVGILTDRDIAIRVVAKGLPPGQTPTGAVMSGKLVTVDEAAGLGDSIRLMRASRIRRLPVLRGDGTLAGIVTLDDLFDLLAEEMDALVKLIRGQQDKALGART